MKNLLLAIGVALSGMLCSFSQAQVIPLTVDSAQSSVDVTINGSPSDSQLSGTVTLDLEFTDPPSGNAQITDVNLVLDDSLSASFAFGFVRASTSPGDVTLSMVTPGAPGTIAGTSFDQLANLVALEGDLEVRDLTGFAGGNQTVDLSTLEFPPFDFNAVEVTQSGDVVTISSSFTFSDTADLGGMDVPIVVDVTLVASGVVPEVDDVVLLGDVNKDDTVDFDDISPFISLLATGGFQAEADIDLSTEVDFDDIAPFITILSGP